MKTPDLSVFNSLSRKHQYKYPYVFFGFYLTFLLSTVCLANRIITINHIVLPGGIFVFPLTFCICDIVGEVYGYAYPRLFIWIGIFAEFIFSIMTIFVSHITAPDFFFHQNAYITVFDPTFRYVFSGLIALIIGEFINIYLLSKAKIIFKGKYFIMRSLISTAIGQATLTLIVDLLNYTGKMPTPILSHMMISGFTSKMLYAALLAFPSWSLIQYLKKTEGIDHYDFNTNFNPFILTLDDKINSH